MTAGIVRDGLKKIVDSGCIAIWLEIRIKVLGVDSHVKKVEDAPRFV